MPRAASARRSSPTLFTFSLHLLLLLSQPACLPRCLTRHTPGGPVIYLSLGSECLSRCAVGRTSRVGRYADADATLFFGRLPAFNSKRKRAKLVGRSHCVLTTPAPAHLHHYWSYLLTAPCSLLLLHQQSTHLNGVILHAPRTDSLHFFFNAQALPPRCSRVITPLAIASSALPVIRILLIQRPLHPPSRSLPLIQIPIPIPIPIPTIQTTHA